MSRTSLNEFINPEWICVFHFKIYRLSQEKYQNIKINRDFVVLSDNTCTTTYCTCSYTVSSYACTLHTVNLLENTQTYEIYSESCYDFSNFARAGLENILDAYSLYFNIIDINFYGFNLWISISLLWMSIKAFYGRL